MLEYDTTKRATAAQMLMHPWVNGGKSSSAEAASSHVAPTAGAGSGDLSGNMAGLALAGSSALTAAAEGGQDKSAESKREPPPGVEDASMVDKYDLVGAAVQV